MGWLPWVIPFTRSMSPGYSPQADAAQSLNHTPVQRVATAPEPHSSMRRAVALPNHSPGGLCARLRSRVLGRGSDGTPETGIGRSVAVQVCAEDDAIQLGVVKIAVRTGLG